MYEKNLTEDFRLRLSKKDMEFLRKISADRRSLETLDVLKSALKLGEEKGDVHGDTKTDFDDLI